MLLILKKGALKGKKTKKRKQNVEVPYSPKESKGSSSSYQKNY